MKALPETPAIWAFIDAGFRAREAIACGTPTRCEWIEDSTEPGTYLVDWNDWDADYCESIEEVSMVVDDLIIRALTDVEFRRQISGAFYRAVVYVAEDAIGCGDKLDGPIYEAIMAARKATAAIQLNNRIRIEGIKDHSPEHAERFKKSLQSYDRYLSLANAAYHRACAFADTFGWEYHMERFIETGEPCEACRAEQAASNVIQFPFKGIAA